MIKHYTLCDIHGVSVKVASNDLLLGGSDIFLMSIYPILGRLSAAATGEVSTIELTERV